MSVGRQVELVKDLPVLLRPSAPLPMCIQRGSKEPLIAQLSAGLGEAPKRRAESQVERPGGFCPPYIKTSGSAGLSNREELPRAQR